LPELLEVRRQPSGACESPAEEDCSAAGPHMPPGEDGGAQGDVLVTGMAHAGMTRSARWLCDEIGPALRRFYGKGYKVVITGHSLGGAVATLFSLIESPNAPPSAELRCVSFGTPACVDATLADYTQGMVQSVLHRDDIVPRASAANVLRLVDEVREFATQGGIKAEFKTDWEAVKYRAYNLWEPTRRGAKRDRDRNMQVFDGVSNEVTQLAVVRQWRSWAAMRQIRKNSQDVLQEAEPEGDREGDTALPEGREKKRDPPGANAEPPGWSCDAMPEEAPHSSNRTSPHLLLHTASGGSLSLEKVRESIESVGKQDMGGEDISDDEAAQDCDEAARKEVPSNELPPPSEAVPADRARQDEDRDEEQDEDRDRDQEHVRGRWPPNRGMLTPSSTARYVAQAEAAFARAEAEQATHLTAQERFKLSKAALFVPGDIAHIYMDRGRCHAAKVPRSFSSLTRIELQPNMVKDHGSQTMYRALQGVKVASFASEEQPQWQRFNEADYCSCCDSDFSWNSTLESEAQQMRDRYNCRACGLVVCDACSQHRVELPRIGVHEAARICDRCRWGVDIIHFAS